MNHWTFESWGSEFPPINCDDVCNAANELIDAYAQEHDERDTNEYNERLWEEFCATGTVNGISATYE